MSAHRNWIDTPSPACMQWTRERVLANPDGFDWFALLDRGFCDAREWRSAGLEGRGTSLYGRYRDDRLLALSPVLLPLGRGEGHDELCQRLFELSAGRPMLSFIGARSSPEAMVQHLRSHLEACVEAATYLVRYADTRCLPEYADVLKADQRGRFLQGIVEWCFVGRDGEPARLPAAASRALDGGRDGRLILDTHQHSRLKRSAMADTVLEYLRRRPLQFGRLVGHPSRQHACTAGVLVQVGETQLSADIYKRILVSLREHGCLLSPGPVHDSPEAQNAA